MTELTGKQIRHLRAEGHHLKPVVMIGREGMTERVIGAADENLTAHELIKVKLQEGCDMDRREAAEELANRTGSALVQVLGRTFLLYRPSENNRIVFT